LPARPLPQAKKDATLQPGEPGASATGIGSASLRSLTLPARQTPRRSPVTGREKPMLPGSVAFNWRWACKLAVVAAAYYGAARLGLLLQLPGTSASPVWPPSGIGLAA